MMLIYIVNYKYDIHSYLEGAENPLASSKSNEGDVFI